MSVPGEEEMRSVRQQERQRVRISGGKVEGEKRREGYWKEKDMGEQQKIDDGDQ